MKNQEDGYLKVLTSRNANERIKNKARDIKELLNEDKKKAGIS